MTAGQEISDIKGGMYDQSTRVIEQSNGHTNRHQRAGLEPGGSIESRTCCSGRRWLMDSVPNRKTRASQL